MKAILAGAFMALSITAASAHRVDYSTGAWDVYHGCKAILGELHGYRSDSGIGWQWGYCGMMVSILMKEGEPLSRQLCTDVPHSVTIEQGVRVVVRFIEAHPQRMWQPFSMLAAEALYDAWPCKQR